MDNDFKLFPMDILKRFQQTSPILAGEKDAMRMTYALQNDLTNIFHLDILEKLSKEGHDLQHVVDGFVGPTGSGKSWGGIDTALFISLVIGKPFIPHSVLMLNPNPIYIIDDKDLTEDQKKIVKLHADGQIPIAFRRTQMRTQLQASEKAGDFIKTTKILDEKSETSKVGHGAKAEEWALLDIKTETRSLGMNFIYIGETIEDNFRPHFLLQSQKEFNPLTMQAKHLISFLGENVPSGFVSTNMPMLRIINIYEFLKRYNQIMRMKGVEKGRLKAITEAAETLAKHPMWEQASNDVMRRNLLEEVFGDTMFTTAVQEQIINMAIMMGRVQMVTKIHADTEEVQKATIDDLLQLSLHMRKCAKCRTQIVPMLDRGMNQNDVARELHVSPMVPSNHVAKIVKEITSQSFNSDILKRHIWLKKKL